MVCFPGNCALRRPPRRAHDACMDAQPLYQRLADHYRRAIQSGVLAPAERMPSVRSLVRTHRVSLSTALQACRQLEDDGLIEARPRSGYFVRPRHRASMLPRSEEHTSELQSLMRLPYAVFCLKKKNQK